MMVVSARRRCRLVLERGLPTQPRESATCPSTSRRPVSRAVLRVRERIGLKIQDPKNSRIEALDAKGLTSILNFQSVILNRFFHSLSPGAARPAGPGIREGRRGPIQKPGTAREISARSSESRGAAETIRMRTHAVETSIGVYHRPSRELGRKSRFVKEPGRLVPIGTSWSPFAAVGQ